MRSLPTIQQLLALRTLVTCGNLREASESLAIDKSTLLFHIRKLERVYGVRLVDFRGSKPCATEAANILADCAQGLLALLRAAEEKIDDLNAGPAGSITVALTRPLASYLIFPVVQELKAQSTPLEYQFLVGGGMDFTQALRKNTCDIAIVPETRRSSLFEIEYFFSDKQIAVVSSRFASEATISNRHNFTLAVRGAGTGIRPLIDSVVKVYDLGFKDVLEYHSVEQLKGQLITGPPTIGLTQRYPLRTELSLGLLEIVPDLMPPGELAFFFMYDPASAKRTLLRTFIAACRKALPADMR